MIDQTEELLRAGMERFTADTDVPPGLAARAARRRRRAKRTRAAAVIGVAAAAAVTAAVVTAPGPAPRMQTTAYVLSHVQGALSQVGSQNAVQYVRETSTARIFLAGSELNSQTVGSWTYRGQNRSVLYTPDGAIIAVIGYVPVGRQVTDTLVNYQEKTWWRDRRPVTAWPGVTPTPESSCAQATVIEGGGAGDSNVAGDLRTALSCGEYVVAGHQRVDGVLALRLKPAKAGPMAAVFWVDPSTYLPVRDRMTVGRATIQDDFRWLPPTPANLATLDVSVPPGFTQVSPPA